ncbi:MAG: hypothetical protein KDE27_06780, partial [Planctomycetes bacterium]|nr:hypothetical protein [Planctomycetota bacterium]
PVAAAYEFVTAGDRRPLLVMRECERCKGTDHALLSRTLSNEQTVLLTGWFRCVKLPPNVLEADHPFRSFFAKDEQTGRIPHLFFADPDGSNQTPLPGDQSQAELWETMFGFLDRCYEGNAKKALKELRKLLDQHDRIDGLELEVVARMERELDRNGPTSSKVKKLQGNLDKLQKERDKLFARERELRALALKNLALGEGQEAEPATAGSGN